MKTNDTKCLDLRRGKLKRGRLLSQPPPGRRRFKRIHFLFILRTLYNPNASRSWPLLSNLD